ncbi:MAG: phosphate/phosphite/phosphonate ABC transporter substrate-binding protein [Sulfurimicrobium sp.]|nr:phosphate/phosphite/phosphonate ABC transporter substrate-binding protein [Sulfurimicrobium sp.]
MRLFWLLAAVGLAGLMAATRVNAAEKEVYILAVVPQFTPSEVHRNWTPFVEKLSKATQRRFEVRIYPSIPKFEEGFLNGEIDLAFMNPYHAVMAKRAQGYIPLVRDGANPLSGILVVRRDSPVKTIKELNGRELAFPAPNAFGASLYMRALLAEQEKISITPRYVKTHTNVYRHVIMGEVAAGGGVNNTLKHESPEVQAQLRVLFETPAVAAHPLAAHPRMPEGVRQAVTAALLDMGNDPAWQGMLAEMQMSRPVKADYARDYQALEKLKLEKYVVIEKN